jgi:hypothetical protein
MARIILTEEEKKKIKDMYSDVKSSRKLMSYLKRNFKFYKPIDEMGLSDENKQNRLELMPFLKDMVKIVIDDKSYTLNNEKKYIKSKIFNAVEDDMDRIDPEATKAVVLKTIKEYIDNIMISHNLK